ncbi:hypothetical protein Pint_24102 [Pistacia integerrima]|uniref:Uncharacterized protein n=1 Tax=Pistacia integerrima TaxID=434235 RepID=A0ACC0YP32_9ROSI|nr:hypothetical protein Pint_24102 [Pistacia integerrima]
MIVQLINQEVSDELLRNMKEQAQEFFALPLQEKKRWAQKPGSLEGYGQAFVTSPQQKLEWNDMLFLKTLPPSIRNQNLWPQKPQKFRETLETYSGDMRKVAISLATFIAMALEIETHEEISRAYQEGTYEVRMNLYPPCPESELVIGILPHADISGITLLLECGDMPRLEALKDGQWVTVLPKHGAIVVNLGHITEVCNI